jgi:hypothetical protein
MSIFESILWIIWMCFLATIFAIIIIPLAIILFPLYIIGVIAVLLA